MYEDHDDEKGVEFYDDLNNLRTPNDISFSRITFSLLHSLPFNVQFMDRREYLAMASIHNHYCWYFAGYQTFFSFFFECKYQIPTTLKYIQ